MKKAFNIFWIIFVGISSAIVNALTGVAMCCTLIGIPFGLQYFKFIPLVFAPAGKAVATRFGKRPVMNTLWLIFGGLEVFLIYLVLILLFCITVVGIPIARQLFKLAIFNLAPFGAEVVEDGEYTKGGDTEYDYRLFFARAAENLDAAVDTDFAGFPKTMREVFIETRGEYEKTLKKLSMIGRIDAIVGFIPMLALIPLFVYGGVIGLIVGFTCGVVLSMLSASLFHFLQDSVKCRFYQKTYGNYLKFYPNGSPKLKVKGIKNDSLWYLQKAIYEHPSIVNRPDTN